MSVDCFGLCHPLLHRAIVTTTAFIAAILPASAQNLDAETEKQLRSDAAHAWQFFERKTTAIPGLTAPNIWRNDDGQYDSYDTVTMWDAGSIVLATVSARSLGLIDDAQFDTRLRGLLDFFNRAVFTYKATGSNAASRAVQSDRRR